MGRAYSTNMEKRNTYRILVVKPQRGQKEMKGIQGLHNEELYFLYRRV
jgi:hypothetical protein